MIKNYIGAVLLVAAFVAPSFAQDNPGVPDTRKEGFLKVCKVAGPGVAVGTPFTFTTSPGYTFQVPAGTAPGGNCWVGGYYPVGTSVTITEAAQSGTAVSSITAIPGLNSSNPGAGTANVTIGSGVTEVTYTNKATGYLEICKFAEQPGDYTFQVGANGQTAAVPAMSCSPAIQVTAGTVPIVETHPNNGMAYCYQWHGTWTQCPVNGQSTNVTVYPGDVTNQTIVLIVDIPHDVGGAAARTAAPANNAGLQSMLKRLGIPPIE